MKEAHAGVCCVRPNRARASLGCSGYGDFDAQRRSYAAPAVSGCPCYALAGAGAADAGAPLTQPTSAGGGAPETQHAIFSRALSKT